MTQPMMDLRALVERSGDADLLREVIGSEAGPFWTDFLRDLVRRGLGGVKLVVGDAQEHIKAASAQVLSTTWQRSRVHFQRNALAHAPKSSRRPRRENGPRTAFWPGSISAFIATAFAQTDHATAKAQWRLVADQMRPMLPKLATLMDSAEEDGALSVAAPCGWGAARTVARACE